jgi:thiamine pyrophosphate-dependent acetolactate synthase large subunit-like protein
MQPPAPARAAKADLDAAVKLLKDAKRPVILMGRTDWTDEGWKARIALAERLGAVVGATPQCGQGALPRFEKPSATRLVDEANVQHGRRRLVL